MQEFPINTPQPKIKIAVAQTRDYLKGPILIAICYLFLFGVTLWIFDLLLEPKSSYDYAHFFLLRRIVKAELIYFPFSLIVYESISRLISAKCGSRNQNGCQIEWRNGTRNGFGNGKKWIIFLLVLLFIRHAALFTVYNNINVPIPTPLNYFIWTTFGFWFHLVGFLLLFVVMNILTCMYKSLTTRSILCGGDQSVLTKFRTSNAQTEYALILSAVVCLLCMVQAQNPNAIHLDVDLVKLKQGDSGLKGLNGLKIALLTDVHLGPTVTVSHVEKMVDLTLAEKPDLILIVGDLMDGYFEQFSAVLEPLRRLKAKRGVFYATGNHEYYLGEIGTWLEKLNSVGITPLRNENRRISGGICLIGLDDVTANQTRLPGHSMDIEKAFRGCDPNDVSIVMAHHPIVAKIILNRHSPDFILCGHTHAGQIYVLAPMMYFLMPFFHGLYRERNGTQIYVSSGVYYWGTPMKMLGFSEIPILRLK